MSRIAFIGLGAMGLPIAKNLMAGGHEVTGFDLRTDAMDQLAKMGGTAAASAADAAAHADVLMLMVVDAQQARTVLFDAGALQAFPTGGIVVLTATCPPIEVESIAAAVESTNRLFADAPVSGGTVGAEAGTLSIMVGANAGVFAELRPIFDCIAAKLFHVGERPGAGAAMKVVNQLLCGVHIAAAAEALALARCAGVDETLALEILSGSAAASWMLNDRGPRMLLNEPHITSTVDIFVKDLGLVLDAGRNAKAALPLTALAHQLFLSTSGRGDGGKDDSQVIRAYRLLNGDPS